ncbi:MAG: phage protease, partial [Thermoleophilia bacterium]|nr:phage protease [Thermoleophilia bacterium]
LYTSPSFYHDQNRATRLRAVALVTSPALARQPALAQAGGQPSEPSMKSIAAALGLAEGADEAACLSAVSALKGRPAMPAIAKALGLPETSDDAACLSAIGSMVPKTLHDQTVASLTAASGRIDALEKAGRDKDVADLFERALKERRIVPAQVATLTALCATEEGLKNVKAHIMATTPGLQPSGLDDRGQPAGGGDAVDAVTLSAAAQKIQDDAKAAGRPISFSDAITLAQKKPAA